MIKYPKINTIWKRDERGNVVPGDLSEDVFAMIEPWLLTEKVDGTNIRVCFDGHSVVFGGRTDKAQIPANLLEFLMKHFTVERMKAVFCENDLETPIEAGESVILFGEGYGPGIQKGGKYSDEVGFVLFDVVFTYADSRPPLWCRRPAVLNISDDLCCEVVDTYGVMSAEEATAYCACELTSLLARDHGKKAVAEGIVARPVVPVFDARGKPIMWKLKTKDFD